jgi:hypothetical protein
MMTMINIVARVTFTFHHHFVIAAGRPKEAESASMKLLGDHR